MHLIDPRSHRPAIVSACGIDRLLPQDEIQMDIRYVSRSIASSVAAEVLEDTRPIQPQSMSSTDDVTSRGHQERMLQSSAPIGSRHKVRNKWSLWRFSEAIVAGCFCRNHPKPPGIPAKRRGTRKKSRDRTLSGAKSPEKCVFLVLRSGQNRRQTASNRWQKDPKWAVDSRGRSQSLGSWVYKMSAEQARLGVTLCD